MRRLCLLAILVLPLLGCPPSPSSRTAHDAHQTARSEARGP